MAAEKAALISIALTARSQTIDSIKRHPFSRFAFVIMLMIWVTYCSGSWWSYIKHSANFLLKMIRNDSRQITLERLRANAFTMLAAAVLNFPMSYSIAKSLRHI